MANFLSFDVDSSTWNSLQKPFRVKHLSTYQDFETKVLRSDFWVRTHNLPFCKHIIKVKMTFISRNKIGLIFLSFVAIAMHRCFTAEDVFTSLSEMESLLEAEGILISHLNEYISASENKLDKVKRFFLPKHFILLCC